MCSYIHHDEASGALDKSQQDNDSLNVHSLPVCRAGRLIS